MTAGTISVAAALTCLVALGGLAAGNTTGLQDGASSGGDETAAVPSAATDMVFIDVDRSRIEPDYRVSFGPNQEDGSCAFQGTQYARMTAIQGDDVSLLPEAAQYWASGFRLVETSEPCVFTVETYVHSGVDALVHRLTLGLPPGLGEAPVCQVPSPCGSWLTSAPQAPSGRQ